VTAKIAAVALGLLLAAGVVACGGGGRPDKPAGTGEPSASASSPRGPGATGTAPRPAAASATSPSSSELFPTPTPPPVNVVLADFIVAPDVGTYRAGEVTFTVRNGGQVDHNLLIIKTDLPADALPTDEDGAVDELSDSLEVTDEVFDLAPGDGDLLTTKLEAGSYVLICNVVDDAGAHYQLGMRVGLTVVP
jgi:uncharacterized cupredoxin-like copper-binding protein